MHCSANVGESDVAISLVCQTGKTTLSTDPKRKLIGDDMGMAGMMMVYSTWRLLALNHPSSKKAEPDIYGAIKRDALLEMSVLADVGSVDFDDGSKTENTDVSLSKSIIMIILSNR